MNKTSVVHIILVVLAFVSGIYGVYLGVGASHAYQPAQFYVLMAIMFGGATKVLS